MKHIIALCLAACLGLPCHNLSAAQPLIVQNGNFEQIASAEAEIPSWAFFTHIRPKGTIVLDSSASRSGSNSLAITNQTGQEDFTYMMVSQLVKGLRPGREYVLKFWGKGKISGEDNSFGVSSDQIGNIRFQYVKVLSSDEWVEYQVEFTADDTGEKYIIFRTSDIIEDYHIDDVTIEALE